MLRQFSLASIGLVVGSILTIVGFVAYVTGNATLNLAGFFYGFPLFLGGLALKTTELKPVKITQPPSDKILALRATQATNTQNKLRRDVTRYVYGQDIHLDRALDLLELKPLDNGACPILEGLYETSVEGAYTLVLEFKSPFVPMNAWENRLEKIENYFGPGIRAVLSQPQDTRIHLALIAQPDPTPVEA